MAVFESLIWCWLDLAHVFLWAAFLPEWSSCGLCTSSRHRARDCTLSLVRPSVITCLLTKLLWHFVSSVAYAFQSLQLATCRNQLHCPYHNALVFLNSTSAQLLFCSLDVMIAQNLCENHTIKLIGSTLLPHQCFVQTLRPPTAVTMSVIFSLYLLKVLSMCSCLTKKENISWAVRSISSSIRNVSWPHFKTVL